jgi:hypothetical protein
MDSNGTLYLSPTRLYHAPSGRFLQKDPLPKISALSHLGRYATSILAYCLRGLASSADDRALGQHGNAEQAEVDAGCLLIRSSKRRAERGSVDVRPLHQSCPFQSDKTTRCLRPSHADGNDVSPAAISYEYADNKPNQSTDALGLHANCFCGPDITLQLRSTMRRLLTDFTRFSLYRQALACRALISAPTLAWAWDIVDLHNPEGLNRLFGHCPTEPDCRDTVQVDGACFLASRVNYVMWGLMNRLCGWPLRETLARAALWKHFMYQKPLDRDTVGWVAAGHQGWPDSGQTPPATERSKCQVDMCGQVTSRMRYRWLFSTGN